MISIPGATAPLVASLGTQVLLGHLKRLSPPPFNVTASNASADLAAFHPLHPLPPTAWAVLPCYESSCAPWPHRDTPNLPRYFGISPSPPNLVYCCVGGGASERVFRQWFSSRRTVRDTATVTPAEAGVQVRERLKSALGGLDSGLRRNDKYVLDTLPGFPVVVQN